MPPLYRILLNYHPLLYKFIIFYEEMPGLFVIAAGSLLETLIGKKISFPVGRVEFLPVRPCSFPEFLVATGEEKSIELLMQIPFPEFGHSHLLDKFKIFTFTGGMPEVVDLYSKERSLAVLNPVYDALVVSYLDDVEKYARNDTMNKVIRHIITHSFNSAAMRITFQGFGNMVVNSAGHQVHLSSDLDGVFISLG